MSARKHFDNLYGHLNLSESDLAWFVFKAGYDCAQAEQIVDRGALGDVPSSTKFVDDPIKMYELLTKIEANWLKRSEQKRLDQRKDKIGMRLSHD